MPARRTFPDGSEHDRFDFQANAEPIIDALLDGRCQGQNILPRRAPLIDDHQRLFGIDRGPAHGPAFPAAGLDEPAGRELDLSIGQGIADAAGVPGLDAFQSIAMDYRILEKAAGAAQQLGIGQLGPAQGADGIEDPLGIGTWRAIPPQVGIRSARLATAWAASAAPG